MRILAANNYYFLKGGSERVFFDEADLLTRFGHEVIPFSVLDREALQTPYARYFVDPIHFDGRQSVWNKAKTAFHVVYSFRNRMQARRIVEESHPDLAHVHNIYHRLHPAILSVFRAHAIPVVLTLHDYKLICPTYTLYNHGSICERCSNGHYRSCVAGRCNKGSLLSSLVNAVESYVHRLLGLYSRNVSVFVAPSQFIRERFTAAGWDPSRIVHVPNFVDVGQFRANAEHDGYFLYVGRLSREKGIATLIRAFRGLSGRQGLVLAGSGPFEAEARRVAGGDDRVRFTGHLSGDELKRTVSRARAVVLPSEWFENAPMAAMEAMAQAKPVIGARIGGIPEIVRDGESGILFESGNVESLRNALAQFIALRADQAEALGRGARLLVERNHGPDEHMRRLMAVYRQAESQRRPE